MQSKREISAFRRELLGTVQGTIIPGSVCIFEKTADGVELMIRLTGEPARLKMREMHLESLARAATARAVEIKKIRREKMGMTQEQFARVLGVSPRTLQQWEQRRRKPSGAAKVLLAIARKHPNIVKKAAEELALT